MNNLTYPYDPHFLLRKKRSIRRELLERPGLVEKRVAILGGSTTAELRDMLELFLLRDGIRPVFHESGYNRYFEEAVFPDSPLEAFRPEIVYIHTSVVNIPRFPVPGESEAEVDALLDSVVGRFREIWERIESRYGAPVIQNNFDLPPSRVLGNLDCYDIHGRTLFVTELNRRFAAEARMRANLHLNDLHYLAARFGLDRWHDRPFWHSFKYAMSCEAIPSVADSVAAIVRAILGKSRKCLVLDLDNTLWGGVIGDDGLAGIVLGKETGAAEAFTEFQGYVRDLAARGVILAVCSKNDEANAREGFSHPDSLLSPEDFSVFRANWEPKHENIREIARTLNIGIDSLVFVDDNPVEREIVRTHEPQVAVPEVGAEVAGFIGVLEKGNFFETVSLSAEDLARASFYAGNAGREQLQDSFEDYGAFLRSLEMVAEIRPFEPVYLERITQLTNKTNQFNLTTRRYTAAEMERVAADPAGFITLYGRLIDRFGDNGLVSVMVGAVRDNALHLDLWLMSCRVIKRGMEAAMFGRLLAEARNRGLAAIYGYYFPTPKNTMVSGLFAEMGFTLLERKDNGDMVWKLEIDDNSCAPPCAIEVRP